MPQDPVASLQILSRILVAYGEVSGYKINNTKSVLMDLEIWQEAKEVIKR